MNAASEYEKFLKEIIVKAGKATLKYYGKNNLAYTKKHINDPVTKADLASNRIIIDGIKRKFPDHGIISEEENDHQEDAEYVWIVDPLDGTLNYSKRIPLYGVMIALARKNELQIAGIYLPYFKDLYFAKKGKGTFKNGKRVHCSKRDEIKNTWGIVSIDMGRTFSKKIMNLLRAEQKYNLWFTELGALALDVVYAAEGKKDWYVVPYRWGGLWDYAAPALILQESGCKVTDLNGIKWKIKGKIGKRYDDISIFAANPIIHRKLLKVMNGR